MTIGIKETKRGWRWSVIDDRTGKTAATSVEYYTARRSAVRGSARFAAAAAEGRTAVAFHDKKGGHTAAISTTSAKGTRIAARTGSHDTKGQAKKAAMTAIDPRFLLS